MTEGREVLTRLLAECRSGLDVPRADTYAVVVAFIEGVARLRPEITPWLGTAAGFGPATVRTWPHELLARHGLSDGSTDEVFAGHRADRDAWAVALLLDAVEEAVAAGRIGPDVPPASRPAPFDEAALGHLRQRPTMYLPGGARFAPVVAYISGGLWADPRVTPVPAVPSWWDMALRRAGLDRGQREVLISAAEVPVDLDRLGFHAALDAAGPLLLGSTTG